MSYDRSLWRGANTMAPDCSSQDPNCWGFANFEHGTVGAAILDWIINTWDEIDDCFDKTIEQVVLEEFDFYINNIEISKAFRDAWMRDYAGLLSISMSCPTSEVPQSIARMLSYEETIKNWLSLQIRPFIK